MAKNKETSVQAQPKQEQKKQETQTTAKKPVPPGFELLILAISVVITIFILYLIIPLVFNDSTTPTATPTVKPTLTPPPIPTPCVNGTQKEFECVGIYTGRETYYECVNGKWQSRARNNTKCDVSQIEITPAPEGQSGANATGQPPLAASSQNLSSKEKMQALKVEIEKIIVNVLHQNFSCQNTGLNYREEFACASKNTNNSVKYSFNAVNFGINQTYAKDKAPIELNGRLVVYENKDVGNNTVANVQLLCHSNQTLLKYFVPIKDDENKILTNTIMQACPQ